MDLFLVLNYDAGDHVSRLDNSGLGYARREKIFVSRISKIPNLTVVIVVLLVVLMSDSLLDIIIYTCCLFLLLIVAEFRVQKADACIQSHSYIYGYCFPLIFKSFIIFAFVPYLFNGSTPRPVITAHLLKPTEIRIVPFSPSAV